MFRVVVPRLLSQHHSCISTTNNAITTTSTKSCPSTAIHFVARSRSSSSSSLSSQETTSDTTNNKSNVQQPPYNVIFLRHGQSTWNRDNRFIGWTDTPLTEDGIIEAHVAGQLLKESNIQLDEVHTSLLRRSIRTTNIVLMELQQEYIPIYKHWRLNERHYGNLVGHNKKQLVVQYGIEQVKRWRRSYDEPPPPMNNDHPYHPKFDKRYQHMIHDIPNTESLKCTVARSEIYWNTTIVPSIQKGNTLLITGHENNLRSILMKLENISQQDIINLCIPRGIPLVYHIDPISLQPINLNENEQKDSATGFLSGTWLGGDKAVSTILDRDRKQVYDTSIQHNLELPNTNTNSNNSADNNQIQNDTNSSSSINNNNNATSTSIYWKKWNDTTTTTTTDTTKGQDDNLNNNNNTTTTIPSLSNVVVVSASESSSLSLSSTDNVSRNSNNTTTSSSSSPRSSSSPIKIRPTNTTTSTSTSVSTPSRTIRLHTTNTRTTR